MEHYYTAYAKSVNNTLYFFVKKYIRYNEIKNATDILESYGMHTDFDKACTIAGIEDFELKQQLFKEALPGKSFLQPAINQVAPLLSKNFRVEHINNRTALVSKLSVIKKMITSKMPQWLLVSHS
ncbi:hypothetical protein [Ferruginibacter sp.]|uniref:hypothetical protein n=1 Tax=Ferruginibacter sp. TaxID=1940288 RepID=UPI0026596A23|nr:hypothetical protein [Ferruginibacter sp.]